MDMTRTGYLVAEIQCTMKEGCVHLFSKDLPGFNLALKVEDKFNEAGLTGAIEWYFKAVKNISVRVEAAASPLELLGGKVTKKPAAEKVRRVVMTPEFAFA